jgi:hypothetical protein
MMEALPTPLAEPSASSAPIGDWVAASDEFPVRVRWVETAAGKGLEIEALDGVKTPDLLVYWSADDAPIDSTPTPDNLLLGAFNGRRQVFMLPSGIGDHPGELMLYSLAHGEMAGGVALDRAASGGKASLQ